MSVSSIINLLSRRLIYAACFALVAWGGYKGILAASTSTAHDMSAALNAAASHGKGRPVQSIEPLPHGDSGIAALYPNDEGIASHPSVLFHDDFDASETIGDVQAGWDTLINADHMAVVTTTAQGGRVSRVLEMAIPQRTEPLSTGVAQAVDPARDVLFLRWYQKYEPDWFVNEGSVHNAGSISAKYFIDGRATPGERADGRNKFLVNFESENSLGPAPGHLNSYVYWPEQDDRWGDHFFPSGLVIPNSSSRSGEATFGPEFTSRTDFAPPRGEWLCYEFMVKANSPGRRDGRIAMWLHGELIADFPNLRLRDVDSLQIDRFDLSLYIADNSSRRNTKWHDDVVAATDYIGPKSSHSPAHLPQVVTHWVEP